MNSLVLGSDGVIGSKLYSYIKSFEHNVFGTTRKINTTNKSKIFYDLTETDVEMLPNSDIVYFCAANCNINQCENTPKETSYINVTKTLEIISYLVSKGSFVVYLSSSCVFNGDEEYYKVNSPYNPINEYGRQKVAVEQKILSDYSDNVAIVRLSKVLSNNDLRFCSWLHEMKIGKIVNPFYDLYISPISTKYVSSCVYQIGNMQYPGIFHLSGDKELSYARCLELLAKQHLVNTSLIQSVSMYKAISDTSIIQKHTTLCMEETISKFGFTLPKVEDTILSVECDKF